MTTTATAYESVENTKLNYPESNFETFKKRTDWLFEDFENDNGILNLLRSNKLEMHHFHALLNTIFHQVYMGSTSFALGGVHTDSRHYKVREYFYLMQKKNKTIGNGLFKTCMTQAIKAKTQEKFFHHK